MSSSAGSQATSTPVLFESTSEKALYSHFMVGVAYEWTVDEWLSDIKLASSGGIDGFALNAASESLTLAVASPAEVVEKSD